MWKSARHRPLRQPAGGAPVGTVPPRPGSFAHYFNFKQTQEKDFHGMWEKPNPTPHPSVSALDLGF